MPDAAAAERVIEQCDAVAAAEHVALGVSAPGRGVAESRQALREAARAAQLARTLRPGGGALGYEQLGAYKYLRPPAARRLAARPPLDRGRGAARARPPAPHRAARHARGVPRAAPLRRRHGAHALHPPEHAAPAARADRARDRAQARGRGPARARAGGEARQAGRRAPSRRRLTSEPDPQRRVAETLNRNTSRYHHSCDQRLEPLVAQIDPGQVEQPDQADEQHDRHVAEDHEQQHGCAHHTP